ncbi:hypothetical protein EAG_11683 [Camponotus floridanus]|uniref:Uncharacterized protein n=1 Tax=Camponotus floridanus TaxID=104421 RepID=E2AG00_CAMFO|nr:hypothetical protein EAG_11683 [Camponotus floridanus]
MPIHLIELIDIEIGQTFATYRLDRFSVFLPRLLRPLYNLSAFRTTALTCLKSPMRKLHSFVRSTYHNLSVHVIEPRRLHLYQFFIEKFEYTFRKDLIEINASFPLYSSRLDSPIQSAHDVSVSSELRKPHHSYCNLINSRQVSNDENDKSLISDRSPYPDIISKYEHISVNLVTHSLISKSRQS